MTFDQLRYFTAAAKHEHIHRAAKAIPISASVISHAVKSLEVELGCQLFFREKKQIRLTQDGARLLELSKDLLERLDGIQKELGRRDYPLVGHFRVGASHLLAASLLSPVLTTLQKTNPQLTVDVHSLATWDLVDRVLAGKIDFGIGFSPTPHPQLDFEVIYEGRSQVVVRQNHPIFARKTRDHYKMLSLYPGTMHVATEKVVMARRFPFLKAAGLDRNVVFSYDNDFVALENLKNSDNWCLLSDLFLRDHTHALRVVPVPGDIEARYTVQLMKHKTRRMDLFLSQAYAEARRHFQGFLKRK